MPKGYHHLTQIQRSQIAILKDRGDSSNKIAHALKTSPSTISRELKRHAECGRYSPEQAQRKAQLKRQKGSREKITPMLIALIKEKLSLQWSAPLKISIIDYQ